LFYRRNSKKRICFFRPDSSRLKFLVLEVNLDVLSQVVVCAEKETLQYVAYTGMTFAEMLWPMSFVISQKLKF